MVVLIFGMIGKILPMAPWTVFGGEEVNTTDDDKKAQADSSHTTNLFLVVELRLVAVLA